MHMHWTSILKEKMMFNIRCKNRSSEVLNPRMFYKLSAVYVNEYSLQTSTE